MANSEESSSSGDDPNKPSVGPSNGFGRVDNEWFQVKPCDFGFGVYARKKIPVGQVWWQPIIGVNVFETSRAKYCALQRSEKEGSEGSLMFWQAFVFYSFYQGFRDSNWFILDNGRFVNHSLEPNSQIRKCDGCSVAVRDIEEGEQILENYLHFSLCPWPEDVDGYPDRFVNEHPDHPAVCEIYMKTHPVDPVPIAPHMELGVEVKLSPLHGLGLFMTKPACKGTVVWEPTSANTVRFNREAYTTLLNSQQTTVSKSLIEAIRTFSIYNPQQDVLVMNIDNARFFNHSPTPNCKTDETTMNTILARDVEQGEELTDNYQLYHECPWLELLWEKAVGYPRKTPATLDYPVHAAIPRPSSP